MLNGKTILINGCSFSRGPDSWPYHLQTAYNANLVNLSQAGAGNTYIHESTIEELSKRSYDYVIIMWTEFSRLDYKVENISLFDDSKYTSCYQKTKNDWQGKIIFPTNDQDYVDDNWIYGCGVLNNEKALVNKKIFNSLYRYVGHKQLVYHSLHRMIALQSFLKVQEIPYLFTFHEDYNKDLQIEPDLYKLLDWTNIYNNEDIFELAKNSNDIDETDHPKTKTYQTWANLIKEFIDAKEKQ